MYNTLSELFLHTYFLYDSIAGKLVGKDEVLFDTLYSVFLLPESEREELFAQTQREEVKEMVTYDNYAQICRAREYADIAGIESGIGEDIRDIIAVKGSALRKAKQFGYEEYSASTETAVCKLLTESANMGLIPSLCVLGFLQCEGIFVEKNVPLGLANFERAAKWNDIGGILLALRYNEKSRNLQLDRLYTVVNDSFYENVYSAAASTYEAAHNPQILPETKMLVKAFGAGIHKPDLYIPQYARFIYSEILGMKDKERALFSGHKEVIAETADLPLRLTYSDIAFDDAAFRKIPLLREKEQDKISRMALNADMRKDSAYRPLCLGTDSEYLLQLYIVAMSKAFSGAHIERIDVADLNEHDLEPTKNNVFVRSCDEDRQNIYVLYCKGEIKESLMGNVKNFLQSDKRKKFRLQHPGAVIDLSAVLPVCFCDKRNARLLKPFCDVIALSPISVSEKTDILTYILQTKSERYKMKCVQADVAAQKFLKECSVDRAERLIDKAVRFHRGEDTLIVTVEMLKEISDGEPGNKTKYGFGGAENEISE